MEIIKFRPYNIKKGRNLEEVFTSSRGEAFFFERERLLLVRDSKGIQVYLAGKFNNIYIRLPRRN